MTLIELLVTMVLALIVLGALYETYIALMRAQRQQKKLAETNLQVLMALEVLRKDVELAGFGLPRDTSIPLAYQEASVAPASNFNNAPSDLPRPVDVGNQALNQADYLVLRATTANLDQRAARTWGYAYFDGTTWQVISLGSEDFLAGDYCLALDFQKSLVGWNLECVSFVGTNTSEIYFLMGLNNDPVRMPFNRVDYYLDRPADHPEQCHPSTFELYRGEIRQSDGTVDAQPLLDCVLTFEVVAGRDTDGDGDIDLWSSDLQALDAEDVYEQVKEIAVYLIYQEGKRSRKAVFENATLSFTYPNGTAVNVNLPADFQFYRWKTTSVRIKPLNLKDWTIK